MKILKRIIVLVGCISLTACGNNVPVPEEMTSTAYETSEVETTTEEISSEEMTETETVEESTEEITSETETETMETTEEETTTEEEVAKTTGFIITEEEFTARVMFRPHMELMPMEDEFSKALVAEVEARLASYGREIQYKDGMMGRSYPVRFGEDINAVADGIVMDIETFFFDGGNCYEIHHVKKADNGYIVSYSIE